MHKILIVEDDNILAQAIYTAVRRAGFSAEVAVDGEDALKKMKKIKPDVVLLDLILPKRSGEDVLGAMKQDETLKEVPVLVITVKGDKETISQCVKMGIRGYLIKAHYTLQEIINQIKKVIAETKK
ncbi:MAG: response regulator [Candidatus Magasanikbacteria bacterium CG10_big_fil_rev_8_21_14_0_10_36_32]|uniref:Response regulator n=1 Tax=Candidatus Magasanikbacteria bacterium CG10_big_fil_rev_8_21_14_0_10_36_32 TaxID=1974646 RepID=A0A2M6W7H4_9BACT|nr:MAG: response regulator [Candidatus Magasanikbacteria bacterium CG10_big_fil_rev_8_21_14_0_10_36_32]